MALPLLLSGALTLISPADAASIRGVAVTPDAITLSFDGLVERASAFVLDTPRRIAVDIGGASASRATPQLGAPAIVRAARVGQFNAKTARVVFDLNTPVMIRSGKFGADGKSITFGLVPASPVQFASAADAGKSSFFPPFAFRASAPEPGDRTTVTVPLPQASPYRPAALPRIYGPADRNRPLVVIDAGHGGHDPGAISVLDQRHEKDATLAIARSIRDALIRSGQVRVALTRETDVFLPLPERVSIARRLQARLFISIHADSAGNDGARGASIYTLSEVASDKEAARIAAMENKADVISGVDLGRQSNDVQSILIDLAQRETMNVSSAFASVLRRETAPLIPFRSDYHQFANFRVLKAPDTPSVLMETGYVTNMDDAKLLFSPEGQARIARGVARAVEAHFARRLASLNR